MCGFFRESVLARTHRRRVRQLVAVLRATTRSTSPRVNRSTRSMSRLFAARRCCRVGAEVFTAQRHGDQLQQSLHSADWRGVAADVIGGMSRPPGRSTRVISARLGCGRGWRTARRCTPQCRSWRRRTAAGGRHRVCRVAGWPNSAARCRASSSMCSLQSIPVRLTGVGVEGQVGPVPMATQDVAGGSGCRPTGGVAEQVAVENPISRS